MAPRSTHNYQCDRASCSRQTWTRKPDGFTDWVAGDIAFLKSYEDLGHEFDQRGLHDFEKSINHQLGACGHPVIILKASSTGTHFAATTVSAYSCYEGSYCVPWDQECHFKKSKKDFRSCEGSESASNRPILKLKDGKLMPKPKISWVYIQSVFVVPATALKVFTKPYRDHLQLTQESLDDLWAHMNDRTTGTRNIEEIKRKLKPTVESVMKTTAHHRTGSNTLNKSTASNRSVASANSTVSSTSTAPYNSLHSTKPWSKGSHLTSPKASGQNKTQPKTPTTSTQVHIPQGRWRPNNLAKPSSAPTRPSRIMALKSWTRTSIAKPLVSAA